MRKIICMALMVIMSLSLFGCKDDTDYGDIGDANPNNTVQADRNYFTPTENTTGYEFKTIEIGRAQLNLPYPATWEVNILSDYKISFTAPDDDPLFPGQRIYFNSTLDIYPWLDSHHQIHDLLSEDRLSNTFKIKGEVFQYTISPHLSITEWSVNDKIVDANTQMLASAILENATLARGGSSIDSSKNKDYVITNFLWQSIPCSINGLCDNGSAAKFLELQQYMVSNVTYVKPTLGENVEIVPLKESTLSFNIPLCMEEVPTIQDDFRDSKVYVCPSGSLNPLAQTSVGIYQIKTEYFDGLDDLSYSYNYVNDFGKSALQNTKLRYDLNGTLVEMATPPMIAGQASTHKEGTFYLDMPNNDPTRSLSEDQVYYQQIYELQKDDMTFLIVITYPQGSLEVANKVVDLIVQTAKF